MSHLRLRLSSFPIWIVVGLAFALPVARAHSPNETSLLLRADAESLEVLVSLSLPAATSLLPAGAPPLSAATLDQNRPALLAAFAGGCVLGDSAGSTLVPQRVLLSLHDGHEVRFHLFFAPDAQPTRLALPLLAALPRGAFCEVSDARVRPAIRASLTASAFTLDLAAPPPR